MQSLKDAAFGILRNARTSRAWQAPNQSFPKPKLGAPGEPRSRVTKVNQACATNKVSKIPGLNAVSILFATHLLVGSYNAVEVLGKKRWQPLGY